MERVGLCSWSLLGQCLWGVDLSPRRKECSLQNWVSYCCGSDWHGAADTTFAQLDSVWTAHSREREDEHRCHYHSELKTQVQSPVRLAAISSADWESLAPFRDPSVSMYCLLFRYWVTAYWICSVRTRFMSWWRHVTHTQPQISLFKQPLMRCKVCVCVCGGGGGGVLHIVSNAWIHRLKTHQ